jgi:peptidoglycan hydrolase CwlO-like protein
MKKLFFTALLFFLLLPFLSAPPAHSLDFQEISNKISELESKLSELTKTKNTLKNQIVYLDSQVSLTEYQIRQSELTIRALEVEIADLSQKISVLDLNLDQISAVFLTRVSESYKLQKKVPTLWFLTLDNFNDSLQRYKYYHTLQLNDRDTLLSLEEVRLNYDIQKQKKIEKQQQLEALQKKLALQIKDLEYQKSAKNQLLVTTQNDEKTYQSLLAQARAEYEAMQAIISNRGDETPVGSVSQGEKIATVIGGASTCSTGTHLHFEVLDGDNRVDPASVLSSRDVIWANQPDGPFSFTGSWSWPLNGQVKVTQGYGMTWFARVYRYYGGNPHSGLDIVSDDSSIMAVKGGELFNGSINCGGGKLRYVKVKHQDSDHTTYYLHVNYVKS